ncbi:MAG TPA: PEP-CTERM sorting domain-containing protein, partial [Burkholderiaceae bacterium]|nr:PEP-CTERM sorting domain-containing protein [Burkholderiaceae bacterium]
RFFFLHTDATDYAMTALYDLLGGPNQTLSGTFATYAPVAAVPEPASVLLMAAGVLALGLTRRHRARA